MEGAPPPPSPLTGCYLLVVVAEPHSKGDKDIILQRIAKGLLSWDIENCHVDLEKELQAITNVAPEGEEARHGERLIQFASENLVTEVLIHPATNTLIQCMKNLLSSFTRHRHIIHAGYTFGGNGSWALQDGTFSLADFSEAFQENEVQRVIRAYENTITIDIHCSSEGDWSRLPKEHFTKLCKVQVNPNDVLNSGSPSINNFLSYLSPFLVTSDIETLLESSDVVGNIRFSHPTLYVFPGGQGDAALFGINGFNMLVDGGFARKACFWDFTRHLDRLDAVLLTRLNNSNVCGISSVLKRKTTAQVYPQIGHFFCNLQERKAISPDGDKDKDPLIINLLEEGHNIILNLKQLNLRSQSCYRDSDPINLYHKVGHGTLDMYVLSPAKDSKEVKDFLQKWNSNDQKLFANKSSKDFPLPNLVSICALLVWQPANPLDTITRLLFPGSTPQNKIFEGLDRLKHLEFMKHPVCTAKQLTTSGSILGLNKSKQIKAATVLDKILPEQKSQKIIDNKPVKEKSPPNENKQKIENKNENRKLMNGDVKVMKSDSVESDKSEPKSEPKKTEINGKDVEIILEDKSDIKVRKLEPKKQKTPPKSRSESASRKSKPKVEKKETKPSPPTPKKTATAEPKVNGLKDKQKIITKVTAKSSPSATPPKSTKDANNRKVVESKFKSVPKTKETPKSAPEKKEVKVERKPISRRTKAVSPARAGKMPASPSKKPGIKDKNGVSRTIKLDREGTTDSSAVSTPSADQDMKKIDVSKLSKTELEELKAKELADLKEEQEVVKEIEAIFRKDEKLIEDQPDLRKIKDASIGDKTTEPEEEDEEYLIVEKEELEQNTDSVNEQESANKEDEIQKHQRDSEESEKPRKGSDAEQKVDESPKTVEETKLIETETCKVLEIIPPPKEEVIEVAPVLEMTKSKEDSRDKTEEMSKEISVTSPEDKIDVSSGKKLTDTGDVEEENKEAQDQQYVLESQPDEKFSATIESGATTAPTLPEDERIPLDEIKEDQVIEEKYVQEETKEKEIPTVVVPQKTFEPVAKISPIIGMKFDAHQSHIRDIVKTPDEVADLPVHEEVDIDTYDFPGTYKKDDKTKKEAEEGKIVRDESKKSDAGFFSSIKEVVKETISDVKDMVKGKVDDVKEETKKKVDDVQVEIKTEIETVIETVNDEISNVKDKAKDVEDNAKKIERNLAKKIEDTKERIEEKIDDIQEKIPVVVQVANENEQDKGEDENKSKIKDSMEQAYDMIKESNKTFQGATDNLKQKFDDVQGNVEERLEEIKDQIAENAKKATDELIEDTKQVAEAKVNNLKQETDNVLEHTKDKVEEINKQVDSVVCSTEEIAQDKIEEVGEKILDIKNAAYDKIEEINDETEETVKEEFDSLEIKIDSLKDKVKDKEKEAKTIVDEIKDKLEEKLFATEEIVEKQQNEAAEVVEVGEEAVQDVINDVDEKSTDLKAKIGDKITTATEKVIHEIKAEVEQTKQIIPEIEIDIQDEFAATIDASKRKIEDIDENIEKTEEEHEKNIDDVKDKVQKRLDKLKSEADNIEEKTNDSMKISEDRVIDETEIEYADIKEHINKSKQAIEEKIKDIEEAVEEKIEVVRHKISDTKDQIKDLESKIHEKDDKISDNQSNGTEKLEDLKESLLNDMETLSNDLKNVKEDKKEDIKLKIGDKTEDLKEIEKDITQKAADVKSIEINEFETKKGTAENTSEDLALQISDKVKNLKQENKDLKQDIVDKIDNVKSIFAKLEETICPVKEKTEGKSKEDTSAVISDADELVSDIVQQAELQTSDSKIETELPLKAKFTDEEDKEENVDVEDDYYPSDPKSREEDVLRIVSSVAQVLKSEAPLEELAASLPLVGSPFKSFPLKGITTELRETHITTLDSPVKESVIIPEKEDVALPEKEIKTSVSLLEEEQLIALGEIPQEVEDKSVALDDIPSEERELKKESPQEKKINDLIKDSNALIASTSKIISEIKSKDESKEDDTKKDPGVVHRMLVTASSEDGGEETVICPTGSITFVRSDQSGKTSPESSPKSTPKDLSGRSSPEQDVKEFSNDIEKYVSKTVEDLKDVSDLNRIAVSDVKNECIPNIKDDKIISESRTPDIPVNIKESVDKSSSSVEKSGKISPENQTLERKEDKLDMKEVEEFVTSIADKSGKESSDIQCIENGKASVDIKDEKLSRPGSRNEIADIKECKLSISGKSTPDTKEEKSDKISLEDKAASGKTTPEILDSRKSSIMSDLPTTKRDSNFDEDIIQNIEIHMKDCSVENEKVSPDTKDSTSETSTKDVDTVKEISPVSADKVVLDIKDHKMDEQAENIPEPKEAKTSSEKSISPEPKLTDKTSSSGKSTPDIKGDKPEEKTDLEKEVAGTELDIMKSEICTLKDTKQETDKSVESSIEEKLMQLEKLSPELKEEVKEDKDGPPEKEKKMESSEKSTSVSKLKETTEKISSGTVSPDIPVSDSRKESLDIEPVTSDSSDRRISELRNEITDASGISTPELKYDLDDVSMSGKSTPNLQTELANLKSSESGKSTPEPTGDICRMKTPDIKHVSGISIPDLNNDMEEVISNKSTPAPSPDKKYLESEKTGNLSPDLKDSLEEIKSSKSTSIEDLKESEYGKSTPNLENLDYKKSVSDLEHDIEEYKSVKSTPVIPSDLVVIVSSVSQPKEEEIKPGKSSPILPPKIKDSKISESEKSTPDLNQDVKEPKSGKSTPAIPQDVEDLKTLESGKSTPDLKRDAEKDKSGKSTPAIPQDVEDLKTLESGKSTPDLKRDAEKDRSGKSTPAIPQDVEDLKTLESGKSTPHLEQDVEKEKSGKSTPAIPLEVEDPKVFESGKSTPDFKQDVEKLESEKSAPAILQEVKDLKTVESGKITSDLKQDVEEEKSGKSTPAISPEVKDLKSLESGKSTPDIKQDVNKTKSGKSTPETPLEVEELKILESGKSTPHLEQDVEKEKSGKSTPAIPLEVEDPKVFESAKSTPDLKQDVEEPKSGKSTPAIPQEIKDLKTLESGKTTPDLKQDVKDEKSGKSTPAIPPEVEVLEILESGKSTPDLKQDVEKEKSGKSTPAIPLEVKDPKVFESGKSTPDFTQDVEEQKSGKCTPVIPPEVKDLKALESGKSTPDSKQDVEEQKSGKCTPVISPEVRDLKAVESGKSTPDFKQDVEQKSEKSTVAISPEVQDLKAQESRKSSPVPKYDEGEIKFGVSTSAFTQDIKDIKVSDSGKSTPDLIGKSPLFETKHESGKTTPESGKISPDIKDSKQKAATKLSNMKSEDLKANLKQESSEGEHLVNGKLSPEAIEIKEQESLCKETEKIEQKMSVINESKSLQEETKVSMEMKTTITEVKEEIKSGKSTPDIQLEKIEVKTEIKQSLSDISTSDLKKSTPDVTIQRATPDITNDMKISMEEQSSQPTIFTEVSDLSKAGPSHIKRDDSISSSGQISPLNKEIVHLSSEDLHLSGKSTPDIADIERLKEMHEILKHEKHIPGSSTPPTVPVSPIVKETFTLQEEKREVKDASKEKEIILEKDISTEKDEKAKERCQTPGSDDYELGGVSSPHSDISSGQMSRVAHTWGHGSSEERQVSDDEEIPGSPTSVTSQMAHSPPYDTEYLPKMDPMSTSFYGALPYEEEIVKTTSQPIPISGKGHYEFEEKRFLDEADLDFDKAMLEHRQTRGSDLVKGSDSLSYKYEITTAKYSKTVKEAVTEDDKDQILLKEIKKNGFDDPPTTSVSVASKVEPPKLMTSSFIEPTTSSAPVKDPIESWGKPLGLPSPALPPSSDLSNKTTPKKIPPSVTLAAKNKINDERKRSDSPSKYDKKHKKMTPVYMDLTYVPHHGNANYSYIDFFKRIRARYYVFSGIEPSREVYNALLEAKQTWEDKDLEVTIIPTYDTDVLGYWVAENEDLLAKCKIDLSPSASRCTINLQDHETSCSAYRLEF